MTSAESIAAALPFACLMVALFRARLVALALVPSCIGIITMLVGVDLSSASHPLRWIVPIATATLAGFGVWHEAKKPPRPPMITGPWRPWSRLRLEIMARNWRNVQALLKPRPWRTPSIVVASLLILGSCAPDLLALHPWFWQFREWALVPIQIAVCSTVLAVLLAPERWIRRWVTT